MSRPPLQVVARLAFVLTISCAVPALAQERLFLIDWFGTTISEVETAESSFGKITRYTSVVPPPFFGSVTPLAGGRFLIFATSIGFSIFDTRTFSTIALPQWAPVGVGFFLDFDSDAFRPRIFYLTTTEFGVLENPSFTPRVLGATGPGYRFLTYVAASNMLLLTRFSETHGEIVAFDADTGASRGAFPIDGIPGPLLVDRSRNSLHVPVGLENHSASKIQSYNLDTFALMNETIAYPLPLSALYRAPTWTFDPTRERILRADSGIPDNAWAVALDPFLNVVSRVDFGRPSSDVYLMPGTVGERSFALLTSPRLNIEHDRASAFLTALQGETLKPLAVVDLLGSSAPRLPALYSAFLLTPPPAPIGLAHTISGRRVELTWRDPGDATHFVVQVGSEPGRSNLATIHVGNATQFISDAPPGRYYVRVQALNDVGLSLPSNEVVVVVQ